MRHALAMLCWSALLVGGAQAACVCRGCGCKGGPGWRHNLGHCVSHAEINKACGSPLTTRCTYEGAAQVCPSERKQRRKKRDDAIS